MSCEYIGEKDGWGWCALCETHTNAPHCALCLDRGRRYIRQYFRRRDNPKPIPDRPVRSKGLGDTVAKAIKKASGGRIKPCGGCKERQAKLNRFMRYDRRRRRLIIQW